MNNYRWVWPETASECVGKVVGTKGRMFRCVGCVGNRLKGYAMDGRLYGMTYAIVQIQVPVEQKKPTTH